MLKNIFFHVEVTANVEVGKMKLAKYRFVATC